MARQAWADLRDIRDKLHAEVPGLPERVLSDVLKDVTAGSTSISPARLHQDAREGLIVHEMKRLFDPSDPDSTLWDAVVAATKDHQAAVDAPLTAVMTTLGKQMIEDIRSRAPYLHQQFGCDNHLPTIMEKTREKLIENTIAAVVGHLDALREIKTSTQLTPAQKEVLLSYAAGTGGYPPQRLDPVKVKHLAAVADRMVARIGAAKEPFWLFDAMVDIHSVYQTGLKAILEHAETMWISRSLDGTDTESQIIDMSVRLTLAKVERKAPEMIEPRPDPQPEGSSPSDQQQARYSEPIHQFMHACIASPSMYISKLGMFLADILRIGGRADELDLQRTSRPLSLSRCHPALLVRTLAHPSGHPDEGGQLDERGVRGAARVPSIATTMVNRDFRTESVINRERHEARLERAGARADGGDNMTDALNQALASADVIVPNKPPLTIDAGQGNAPAIAEFEQFVNNVPADVGAAIAACLSSGALRNFVGDINAAAFSTPLTMANSRGSHEIWQEQDGSWRVQSTHVSTPLGQGGKPIHTDGVTLYTLTHTITPATEAGGEPAIELSDSKVVFAF
jgi:hypothetical protein